MSEVATEIFGNDMDVKCERNDALNNTSHFVFQNSLAKSCRKVKFVFIRAIDKEPVVTLEVVNKSMNKLARYASSESFGNEGFVHVYNWSVHCNNKNVTCIWNHFEKTLVPFTESDQFRNWMFKYMEHEPKHFKAPDGVFQVKGGKYGAGFGNGQICAKIPHNKADNRRNEEVAVVKVLDAYNLTKRVPIVHQFDDLVLLWQFHNGTDCTHYCYNPNRYDLTRDRSINLELFDAPLYECLKKCVS